MQKNFELNIDGRISQFTARLGTANDVGIYELDASTPCVVLTRSNGLDRALASLVDGGEMIDLAISQTANHGLIARARERGEPVHEALLFVPNEM
jgi:hypothetical protein